MIRLNHKKNSQALDESMETNNDFSDKFPFEPNNSKCDNKENKIFLDEDMYDSEEQKSLQFQNISQRSKKLSWVLAIWGLYTST